MKKNKLYLALSLLILVVILTGCTSFTQTVKNGPLHYGKELDLTVYPEQALGVRVTPALERGEVTVIEVPMTDGQVIGELFSARMNYAGYFASDESEAFAQFITTGNYDTGEYMAFSIIDGKLSMVKTGYCLPLSSRTEYFWDKAGKIWPLDRDKFYGDKTYRMELAKKYGIKVDGRLLITDFDKVVRSWNLYGTDYGDIYSPLSIEDLQRVAKINPGYTGFQRIVLRNKAVISMNPYEMLHKASLTYFEARTKKSQGFDIGSELPTRMQLLEISEYAGKMRLGIIQNLNKMLVEKDTEIEALKKAGGEHITENKKTISPVVKNSAGKKMKGGSLEKKNIFTIPNDVLGE